MSKRLADVRPRGDEIVRRRTELGWSAPQLARKIHRGRSTIHHIEAGRRTTAVTIHQIARALGCQAGEISDWGAAQPDEETAAA